VGLRPVGGEGLKIFLLTIFEITSRRSNIRQPHFQEAHRSEGRTQIYKISSKTFRG